MLEIQKFIRRPFTVDAVLVTSENMQEAAEWCQGEVREDPAAKGSPRSRYVKVRVMRPLNERQTMAFPGDYILYAGTGYKVYTEKALRNSFDPEFEINPVPVLPFEQPGDDELLQDLARAITDDPPLAPTMPTNFDAMRRHPEWFRDQKPQS